MIEPIPFEDDRILGFRISGKVELEDLLPVMDRLNALFARDVPLRGYVEVADFDGVSAEALWKDLSYALKHFRALATRFERVAVVTDRPWIKRLAKVESLMLPGTEERVFDAKDAVEAQGWIAERV